MKKCPVCGGNIVEFREKVYFEGKPGWIYREGCENTEEIKGMLEKVPSQITPERIDSFKKEREKDK